MERDLVLRAQRGDASAFSTLVELQLDRFYGAARLILQHDELARVAAEEALLHLLGLTVKRRPAEGSNSPAESVLLSRDFGSEPRAVAPGIITCHASWQRLDP